MTASLSQSERDDIERSCRRLSIAYARGVDLEDYDLVADCFTQDGELDTGRPLNGREVIRGALKQRPDTLRSRHVLTNIFIEGIHTLKIMMNTQFSLLFRSIKVFDGFHLKKFVAVIFPILVDEFHPLNDFRRFLGTIRNGRGNSREIIVL